MPTWTGGIVPPDPDEDEPIDVAEVASDDADVDAVAAGGPPPRRLGLLGRLLAAWRDDVNRPGGAS